VVTEEMIGHKFGEFAPTREFKGHTGNEKKSRYGNEEIGV
jgi:small subunit ribosomal protein S19